jgi:hypothetical protein
MRTQAVRGTGEGNRPVLTICLKLSLSLLVCLRTLGGKSSAEAARKFRTSSVWCLPALFRTVRFVPLGLWQGVR